MIWTVIDGTLYDITNYIDMHPGGKTKIMKGAFKDSTKMFFKFHKGIKIEKTPLVLLKIDDLVTENEMGK